MGTNPAAIAPRLGRSGLVALAAFSVVLATIAAAILLPSLVIQIVTWFTDDDATTAGFAATVAEPLALIGAVLVAVGFALRDVRFLVRNGWLALVTLSAVFATVVAAWWVGDLDVWTLAAMFLIPGAVALTEWRKRRRAS